MQAGKVIRLARPDHAHQLRIEGKRIECDGLIRGLRAPQEHRIGRVRHNSNKIPIARVDRWLGELDPETSQAVAGVRVVLADLVVAERVPHRDDLRRCAGGVATGKRLASIAVSVRPSANRASTP